MTINDLAIFTQWFYLLFFIFMTAGYLVLNFLSLVSIRKFVQWHDFMNLPPVYSGFEMPISILVPAYNEGATIVASVRSLMQLDYPQFEVIVVNDGSRDKTLEVMKEAFELFAFPGEGPRLLATKPVLRVYASRLYANLRVIDKENGGKADSLNAGLNLSRYPLYCSIDADSVLERKSLKKVVQPFLEEPSTIASGGTIRLANGCRVDHGLLVKAGLPRNLLALMQIVEYLRAFLFGRLGWSLINGMLIISGAFGLFRKDVVIRSGGYRTDTVGEDMELVTRLHHLMKSEGRRYQITFVPDPVCWTEAPEVLKTLKDQRIRWQRGLAESLWIHRKLLFHWRGGTVGWVSFPFMVLFEWFEPLVMISGYLLTLLMAAFGIISFQAMVAYLVTVMGLGIMHSVNALLLEEISFHAYPKFWHAMVLFLAALLENFGYRQMNSLWRLMGLLQWMFRREGQWGEMKRRGIERAA